MREILFRGKTTGDHEWVYGDLLHDGYDYDVAIWTKETKLVTEVLPKTVGQYTGLKDDAGNLIFEGDIIEQKEPSSRTGAACGSSILRGKNALCGGCVRMMTAQQMSKSLGIPTTTRNYWGA